MGRNNLLFEGSDSGRERAAAMYALIGTCALNDIDPRAVMPHTHEHGQTAQPSAYAFFAGQRRLKRLTKQ
jgi:hypothetical protein